MRKRPLRLLCLTTAICAGCLDPVPSTDSQFVLIGTGDIASCQSLGDEATAARLDEVNGTVFTAGDNAYFHGTAEEFNECYAPSWGRHKWRTRPAPGNHDYETDSGAPYYNYFGAAAGPAGKGYYSYDLGTWHIIVLNTNLDVSPGSAQEQWLRSDLATHPALCTLAYWHYPLFSSGQYAEPSIRPLWRALYDAGADVVISGHEHFYERYAPQDPNGEPDPDRGIRQFIVGTGGYGHHRMGVIARNSEIRNTDAYGLIKLTLNDGGYEWEFIPVRGARFFDHGTDVCH
jgi:acid phosphatase type 7